MNDVSPWGFPAILVEHCPGSPSFVTTHVLQVADIEDAIDRLDCDEYSGLLLREDDRFGPVLTIAGCMKLGYLVGFSHLGIDLVAVGDEAAVGSVDLMIGNQEVDRPRRQFCGRPIVDLALQEFLASQSCASGVVWEDRVESRRIAAARDS